MDSERDGCDLAVHDPDFLRWDGSNLGGGGSLM